MRVTILLLAVLFFACDRVEEVGSLREFDAYTEIMERRSRKIEADQQSITKQALKV